MKYENFIKSLLRSASKIALQKFGKVKGVIKAADPTQILTEADLAISRLVVGKIRKFYSNHNIIDEETGVINNHAEYTWVIDPLDGTSNFAVGIPFYGIMIGLLYKNQPIVGGVSLPFSDEIFYAERGRGAYSNGQQLKVTKKTQLLNSLMACQIGGVSNNYRLTKADNKILGQVILCAGHVRTTGSVYDFMLLAQGRFGGVIGNISKIWDNVAQQVIVEEAGGVYTDLYGKKMDYSNPLKKVKENYTVCAASPALHKILQQIIHGV